MPVQMPPVLTAGDLARFTGLVRRASGIEVPEVRRTDMELAVAQALAATGLADTEALVTLLEQERGRPVLEAMVEAMTIGETYFFRNRPQFEALTAHILPELIQRRRASRQLRLWSAGCASGEEAYSLAILLEGLLPDLDRWQVLILATDINRQALAKARRGLYGKWSFREVPPDIHENFFVPAGRQYEIVPRLRERVTFAYLNLVEDTYPSLLNSTHTMDLILFRNVLIYFREATARRVVGRLHAALADRGWLVVGHADASPGVFDQFKLHNFPGTVVYQKTTGDAVGSPAAQVAPQVDWWSAAQAAAAAQTAAAQAAVAAQTAGPQAAAAAWTAATQAPARQVAAPARVPRPPARAGSGERAAAAGRPAVAAAPRNMDSMPAGDPYRAALELWQRDQPEEALRLLMTVASAEPRGARAPYLAAKIQANRQHLPEAEDLVAEALRRDPLLAPAHYLLGLILQETGRTPAALDALRRCVYSDPQFVLGHFALANLFLRNGQPERARKSLDNVIGWLANRPRDELVAEGDGLTAGRLTELITAQTDA